MRCQHERIDGKGFPDGVTGDQLSTASQVLAAAADYYALQTGRVAERHYTSDEALAMVKGGVDARYTRPVVEALAAALQEMAAQAPPDRLIQAHPDGDVVVVAHFGAILAALQQATGITAVEAFGHRIDPLSVTELTHDEGRWSVGRINHRP